MDPDAPPLRMGGFWRAHPHAGPTPAEAAATRAHGMSSPRVVAREALARTLAETAERFFQPVAGCACAACDARVVRDRLSYAVQHMKRIMSSFSRSSTLWIVLTTQLGFSAFFFFDATTFS